ncbi:F-box/WD repeat-containing protein pof1 [Smittium mucronatum]|uniref:F-box/WD repeat-containing protein pof1 n=1 Tax=Smittium mucronatum TaxID=133383 RepID=A0A1R0GT16_9FUNG|nr:F-box/WD repeat-containing protein pof1 [Smittium mucronatum]
MDAYFSDNLSHSFDMGHQSPHIPSASSIPFKNIPHLGDSLGPISSLVKSTKRKNPEPVSSLNLNVAQNKIPRLEYQNNNSLPHTTANCYRHSSSKYFSEYATTNNRLKDELKKLDPITQEKVLAFWNTFSSSSSEVRILLLEGVVNNACVKQLSHLNKIVPQCLRIDFISSSPPEIAFKILSYLDAKTLCIACKVSKTWAKYANDNLLWHRMCVQHIDKICNKCGWGLPLLHSNTRRLYPSTESSILSNLPAQSKCITSQTLNNSLEISENPNFRKSPQLYTKTSFENKEALTREAVGFIKPVGKENPTIPVVDSASGSCVNESTNKSWKQIFSERHLVAINWKKMRYRRSIFNCENSEVLCLESNDCYIVAGLLNGNIIISDVHTGEIINKMVGHTEPVTSLCFDDCKLVSGSSDGTVKLWCYRTGDCIRTIRPSCNAQVSALAIKKRQLAIGLSNGSISIYDFNEGKTFYLPGHDEKINELIYHDESVIFSCSDDLTVKRWDLKDRVCTHIYNGHSYSVSSISLNISASLKKMSDGSIFVPRLFSASLDGTIRVWDIDSGKCIKILCHHSEPVWSIASDAFHLISSHNDGRICIWDSDSFALLHVVNASSNIVTSLCVSDSRIDCGDKGGKVTSFDFKNLV